MIAEKNNTLRESLELFHHEHAAYLSHDKDGISAEAKAFFRSHDVAHVLFGCDISLFGEGSVKLWTIFGTTLGFWNHIRAYKVTSAFELARNFTLAHIVSNIFKFLYAIPILIVRARRMHKPWPWADFEPYMDKPIVEIREEFNIQVLERV